MKHAQVIAFGELLWDMLPSGPVLGGAPANFAYRLSTLGLAPLLISRVGNDELGENALGILKECGIDISYIQRDSEYGTGTVDVVLSPTGNASYTINKSVAYDHIQVTGELLEICSECRMFCFGTLVQRAETTRSTLYQLLEKATKAVKFLDINLRKDCYTAETVSRSLKFTDILKLNADEVGVVKSLLNISGESQEEICAAIMETYGIETCLVTMAEKGAIAYTSSGEEIRVPGKTVSVVDTIGSGDAFSAGFVGSYLQGMSLKASCEYANYLGAEVAQLKGGMSRIRNLIAPENFEVRAETRRAALI